MFKKQHQGFTLIEMIVSIALFSVVISIAIPTLLIVVNTSSRSQAVQATVDNVSFAIDSMAASARLGSSFYCTSDSLPISSSLPTGTSDCTNGATTIVFTNSAGSRVAYRFNQTDGTIDSRTDTIDWLTLTSSQVNIAEARFYADGTVSFDGEQPDIRLVVRGSARGETNAPDFYLQTTMTQYVADKGLIFRMIANNTNGGPTLSNGVEFGGSVASAGDIDNNGVIDAVVGSTNDDTGGTNRGAVYVLRMQTDGTVQASTKIANNTNGGPTLADSVEFGVAVAPTNDLDSSGVPDLAVGSALDDTGGTDRGALYILFMNSNGSASSTVKIAHNTNGGPSLTDGERFGVSVASLGDLNNDGVPDLAVGAYRNDTGGTDRGAVYILFMNADGTVSSRTQIASGVNGGPVLTNGDQFGTGVASIGDLNSDGVTDIIVGASQTDTGGTTNSGAGYILFLNSNGTVASSVKIAHNTNGGPTLADNDQFGGSFAGIGDLNKDGVPDIVAGDYESDLGGPNGSNRGAFYLMFMNTNGTVASYRQVGSATNGGPTLTDGDQFGFSVGSIGDVNHDGIIDFATGARLNDTGGADRGAVYMIFGK